MRPLPSLSRLLLPLLAASHTQAKSQNNYIHLDLSGTVTTSLTGDDHSLLPSNLPHTQIGVHVDFQRRWYGVDQLFAKFHLPPFTLSRYQGAASGRTEVEARNKSLASRLSVTDTGRLAGCFGIHKNGLHWEYGISSSPSLSSSMPAASTPDWWIPRVRVDALGQMESQHRISTGRTEVSCRICRSLGNGLSEQSDETRVILQVRHGWNDRQQSSIQLHSTLERPLEHVHLVTRHDSAMGR